MCEILVCIVDQINPDFYMNCKLPKRGDVICVAEDQHYWGLGEASNPDWRILCFADVPSALLHNMTSAEINTTAFPEQPSKTLQFRGFYLEISGTTDANFLKYLADDSRNADRFAVSGGLSTISQMCAQRPVVTDLAIIGSSPTVIG